MLRPRRRMLHRRCQGGRRFVQHDKGSSLQHRWRHHWYVGDFCDESRIVRRLAGVLTKTARSFDTPATGIQTKILLQYEVLLNMSNPAGVMSTPQDQFPGSWSTACTAVVTPEHSTRKIALGRRSCCPYCPTACRWDADGTANAAAVCLRNRSYPRDPRPHTRPRGTR